MSKDNLHIGNIKNANGKFFTHPFNLRVKFSKAVEIAFKTTFIGLLTRGGTRFWPKVVEKHTSTAQEPS